MIPGFGRGTSVDKVKDLNARTAINIILVLVDG